MEKGNWNVVSGLVEGRDEMVKVCWLRDGKGGLWVRMKFEGKECDWLFKGVVKFDGCVEKDKED